MDRAGQREEFRYEAWANGEWARSLKGIDPGFEGRVMELLAREGAWPGFTRESPAARATEVFAHILWAQRIWLARLDVTVGPQTSLEGWIEALTAAWDEQIERREMDEEIAFRNMRGDAFSMPFGRIARQVSGHGIYHRGQLREIVEGYAPEAMVETDFLFWGRK